MSERRQVVKNKDKAVKTKGKKKWLKVVGFIAAALVVILVISSVAAGKNVGLQVYTTKAFNGEITTNLNTSGHVGAEDKKTFYAPANVKVAGIGADKGDIVKEGDLLICFDEQAVEYAKRQSELESKISKADFNSNVQQNNEQKVKLAQAEADIAQYQAQIDNYNKYIDDLTGGIEDSTAAKKASLYSKMYDIQREINECDLALQTPNENTDMEALLSKKTAKSNELNKINNELSMLSDYKTEYDWEDLLKQAKKDLADYETKLSEAKSQKASAEAAIVNGSKVTGYQLNNEKSQLLSEDAGKKYEQALNGIVADFDGVVSQLSVDEGATVQEGTQLMVLESFENVCVEFQASKFDLETLAIGQTAEIEISGKSYTGKVSKINHIAEQNNSGVPMVGARVHIDNPDENIYLGIEAKIKILTAKEDNVLLVPVEAVNIDNEGNFCYIIENGILSKKYVEVGISSEQYIQITGGLEDGSEIVTSALGGIDLVEGTPAVAIPEQ